MRFFRRCAMTSSRVGRSILSLTRSPLSVRAVYWKSGMAHSLRAPLAARRYLGSAGGGLAAGRDRLPVVERRLADHPQELVRRRGHPEAFVLGDLTAHVQLVERIVQRLHPVLLARLHHGRDLLDLLVPNERPYRGGHDEDLARHHAAAALGLLQQRLGDDTLEHERQLGAHLRLLVRREHVDDAVDALHRRIGVQRGEREMPRLGNRQRGGDGLEVAHLADQHDVGVLPQRVLSAAAKLLVSVPISRWFTMQLWWRWMNSIGSSTVMMWPLSSLLILSIIAASVVLLPDPVGPVTSTSPRGFSASFATTRRHPRSSKLRTLNGICRMTS